MYQREIWLAEGYTTVKVEGGRGMGGYIQVCVYTHRHMKPFSGIGSRIYAPPGLLSLNIKNIISFYQKK